MARSLVLGIITCLMFGWPSVEGKGGVPGSYSNEWIMKSSLSRNNINTFASNFGFNVLDQVHVN